MLSDIFYRWREMPWPLRTLCAAYVIVGIVCSVLPLIPGATIDYFGMQLSWREIWSTGVAFGLFVIGPLMTAVGVGLFRASLWVRPVVVVMPILQILPFVVVRWLLPGPDPLPEPVFYVGGCCIWGVVAWMYLFVGRQGKAFFHHVPG